MPLTFAHPAAAVPLRRLGLPLSALVVGSAAPDFLYFLRLAPRGHFGHTAAGLFVFCLPMGLAVLLVFHVFQKRPLAALAPVALQRRLGVPTEAADVRSPRWWGRSAVAVLLGALTHVGWDAFTHAGGWGVERVGALREPVVWGGAAGPPGYTLAQHGSTAIGLALLALWTRAWWRTAPLREPGPVSPPRIRVARVAWLVGVPVAAGVGYAGREAGGAADVLRAFAGHAVVATTSFAFVALLAYGVWRRSRAWRHPPGRPEG